LYGDILRELVQVSSYIKIGYAVKICPFHCFGHWLIQQLVSTVQALIKTEDVTSTTNHMPLCVIEVVSTMLPDISPKRTNRLKMSKIIHDRINVQITTPNITTVQHQIQEIIKTQL